jgi:predicted O-methyltransferase YrrM
LSEQADSRGSALGRNRRIVGATVLGVTRGLLRRREQFRYQFVRETWTAAKRFAAEGIETIELADIPALWPAVVTGYVDDPQRCLIAALAAELRCEMFFEIGTSLGRTTWTVAHHNPGMQIFTLDMPLELAPAATAFTIGDDDRAYFRPADACGEAFRDTAEAAQITQLWGDSATFDYAPWAGTSDLVYVDGAHTYEYVASDTRAALGLLKPSGTIIWDDYATSPGVYEYLTANAQSFDGQVYHLLGTRMAILSGQSFVQRHAQHFPFTGQ